MTEDCQLTATEFEKYTWDVIQSYFNETQSKCLIRHQLESYNDFVLNKIEQIVEGFNVLQVSTSTFPRLTISSTISILIY